LSDYISFKLILRLKRRGNDVIQISLPLTAHLVMDTIVVAAIAVSGISSILTRTFAKTHANHLLFLLF